MDDPVKDDPVKPADGPVKPVDDQLNQLYDYTKFHIGMYTTLVTAIIAVFANDSLKVSYSHFVPFIGVTIGCFIVVCLLAWMRSRAHRFSLDVNLVSGHASRRWLVQLIDR
jgi:hypothetical protein